MRSQIVTIILTLMGLVLANSLVYAADDPVLTSCRVKVRDEVRISAEKEGVLVELPVREGSHVAEGDVLAMIDDREAQAQLKVAEYGLKAARQRAEDTIEERYATKAAEVAKVDWEQDLEANRRQPNAVPAIEIRQKELVYQRSILQIEKAQKDRVLASLDADTKEAERDAALVGLEKRTIRAPFDGEVVDLKRKQSEWTNPGEHILTLAKFDKLYVESWASATQFDRGELRSRPVTVQVIRARGNEITLSGEMVYVAQSIQSDGSYLVRAEIENKRDGDNWLVQPGMPAQMTIHLDGPVQASSSNIDTTQAQR